MEQLTIDFSKRPEVSGKKLGKLTISVPTDLIELIDKLAPKVGKNRSTLSFEYIIEGIQKTMGLVYMAEFHADSKLSDLLPSR